MGDKGDPHYHRHHCDAFLFPFSPPKPLSSCLRNSSDYNLKGQGRTTMERCPVLQSHGPSSPTPKCTHRTFHVVPFCMSSIAGKESTEATREFLEEVTPHGEIPSPTGRGQREIHTSIILSVESTSVFRCGTPKGPGRHLCTA